MTTTTPQITTAEVMTSAAEFAHVATVYTTQKTAQGLRVAHRVALSAWHWLNTSHDYSNEEGEIILTGWQYLGIACALSVSAFLVSCLG